MKKMYANPSTAEVHVLRVNGAEAALYSVVFDTELSVRPVRIRPNEDPTHHGPFACTATSFYNQGQVYRVTNKLQ